MNESESTYRNIIELWEWVGGHCSYVAIFWEDILFTKISLEMYGHSNGVWYYWLFMH